MKTNLRIGALAAALAAAAVLPACSSSTTSSPDTAPETAPAAPAAARETSGGSSLTGLATILSGRYRGSSPGNGLLLDFSTVGARSGTRFDVFVTTSGRYRERNVRRAGVLRLETQGRDVGATYVPHLDATVTPLSRGALRFTDEELQAACTLYFAPAGDGFYGETRGSTTCAVAMPGAVGKWTIEADPAGIRVRNAETGETMRFAREGK